MLLLSGALWALAGHMTFGDTTLRQQAVPSNIISTEPAHDAQWNDPVIPRDQPAGPLPLAPAPVQDSPAPAAEAETPVEAESTLDPVEILIPPEPEPEPDPDPDEAALWDLFHAGGPAEVLAEIARLREEHPNWEPPQALIALANDEIIRRSIIQAVEAGEHRSLIRLANQNPQLFSCAHIDWAWALASARALLKQHDELFTLLAALIRSCAERERLVTLQKAVAWLDSGAWIRLAEQESVNERSAAVDAEFRRTRYDYGVEQLLVSKEGEDRDAYFHALQGLRASVEFYRDADIALLAAWSYMDIPNTASAATWFERVRDWRPSDPAPIRGLALCALAERRYADARRFAEEMPQDSDGRGEIFREAVIGMAQAEYEQSNYAATVQLLADAGPMDTLPRYVRLMAAWSLLHLGDTARALGIFQNAHGQHADEESAQGVFSSLILVATTDELEKLSRDTADEYLTPLIRAYLADQLFARKRFLSARELAPQRLWFRRRRLGTARSLVSNIARQIRSCRTVKVAGHDPYAGDSLARICTCRAAPAFRPPRPG